MQTVVARPPAERALIWIGFPVAGAGVLLLLKLAARWVAGLPWAPLQGPFKLLAAIGDPLATIGVLVVGAVLGVVLGCIAEREYVSARIDDDEVTIVRGDVSKTIARESIAAVFLDGKELVLLDRDDTELFRKGDDLNDKGLESAFRAHGYPWLRGVPDLH